MSIEQYITIDTKSTLFVVVLLYAIVLVIFVIKGPRGIKDIKSSIAMILGGLLCLIVTGIIACVLRGDFSWGTVVSFLLFNLNGAQGGAGFSYILIMMGLTLLIISIINKLRK